MSSKITNHYGKHGQKIIGFLVASVLFQTIFLPVKLPAQPAPNVTVENKNDAANKNFDVERDFRVEKFPVAGGAEIITIFANFKGLRDTPTDAAAEVPLLSVLRDTLGDELVENDRLRHVWLHAYTRPSLAQKTAAAVPFLYGRTTDKEKVGRGQPPPVIDLNPRDKEVWDKTFWLVFKNLILEDFALPVKAATLQYKVNQKNYRRAAIAWALAILSLYESTGSDKVLSDVELRDIQARMMLSNKLLGSLMKSENLERIYRTNNEQASARRGRNWELLRQYSEAQNLFFEPLEMPDGSRTHALLWVALGDVQKNKGKKFDSRFLNIKNPWTDARLANWQGYSETRWFDADNRSVEAGAPGARSETMIPLALYGLDFPKIPVILVDFRDRNNPKKREMSKRLLGDFTKNVLPLARFANLPFFVGTYLYTFVADRRGMDANQATRLRSYAQLKLLLALNASLEPKFRDEIADRLESVSLNPLQNDLNTEVMLARGQYENLITYARRADGLPAQLEKERRTEMMRLKHTGRQRILYSLANALSLGIYKHREEYTDELRRKMDERRQLDFHERYLIETARTSVRPEIDGDLEAVRRSLRFVAQSGNEAAPKTAAAIAKLFSATGDEQTRALCLSGLRRIDHRAAKKELLAIRENQTIEARWRDLSAEYLKLAAVEKEPVKSADAKTLVKIDGN